MKWEANWVLNSLKELIKLGVNLLNQILTGPFSVVGKTLHMISFGISWKCIRVLKDSKWSKGSLFPSYFSTYSIRNFDGRGKEVTDVVKGESVWWTKSSRLLDTRLLRAFIIRSIYSLIICISTTMWGGAMFAVDGRLTSSCSGLLGALLPFGPSWYLFFALVPSWSSSWVLCPTFLWRSCSFGSWFYLMRCSTTVVRV